MFANKYLDKQNYESIIKASPAPDLGMIVVIPCLREPDILKTLDSIDKCRTPRKPVEVIVLINHSELASEEVKKYNQKTKEETERYVQNIINPQVTFHVIGPLELKKKWAGAGVARKKGMDEAVSRFNFLNNPKGIIVSLDADTLVEENYLTEIENHFIHNPKDVGITISFKHQRSELEGRQLEGIELYEKYLKYYKTALQFTGYPHAMFTVGSAFAVTADAYVKRGGMNRRQAGEDFYFLQNLVQLGKVGELLSTTVHPSARLSDRVPFGTGPILQRWMHGEEDLTKTYCIKAFEDLKHLFEEKERLFKIGSDDDFSKFLLQMPEAIQQFLTEDNFWNEITDLNKNCSSLKSYQTRFYHKFNAFRILKFLNFAHQQYYNKENLEEQFTELKSKLT